MLTGRKKKCLFVAIRKIAAIPLALLLAATTIGISPATSRFTEIEENSPAKSRCEELSLNHRINPQHQLRTEAGRISVVLPTLTPHTLGNTQHVVLNDLGGHRLPNGLLAPMTC